jgi:hypothetical protein
VEFEGLVVLALDLEFGLQFLHQKFEDGNLRAEFVNVGSGCGGAVCRWWGLRRGVLSGGVGLLRKGIG